MINVLLYILAGVFVLDALKLRGRASGLSVLGHDRHGEPELVVVRGEDAQVTGDVCERARAYADANELDVIDLVPGKLPTLRALGLVQLVDPRTYRGDRLAAGRTGGHAIAVRPEVGERAGVEGGERDPVALVRVADKLKRYATTSSDLVVVPELRASREDARKRLALMLELVGGATPFILGAQLLISLGLIAAIVFPSTRMAGLIALAAFQLQPALALLATPLRCGDLALVVLLRVPLELYNWLRTVTGRSQPGDDRDRMIEERRPVYAELLDKDTARFFEPRRDDCPICGSTELRVHLRTKDLLQHKPGTFTLERCDSCDHIFQNPRLSVEGLDFYYKDFYDGLGEKGMDFIFGYSAVSYLGRAHMLDGVAEPGSWLDVGGGHGHFCCVARDVWPATRFDGLDLSASIDEAERRGWIDRAYNGLFPEVAPELAAKYDVVSMHHYLEHTGDPGAELRAAHTALADGGHLLIEVPDPQSVLGRVLGRYWIPWFQPQHQHLLSRRNLGRLLEQHGFEAVQWHRGQAHQTVDFLFASFLLLDRLAPPTDLPWQRPASWPRRAWRTAVWTVGIPLILVGRTLDWALGPMVRRWGMSNTYRVLARKA